MKMYQAQLLHTKYRPDIDGLRAIAVLAVVAFHAFPSWVRGGFIGVDVFFVISGYLISTILFENLDNGNFSFFEFYSRRIRRIFPALLLVLISCYAFGWFALLSDEYKQLGKHIAGGAGFVSNVVLWSEAGYFDNSAETKPLLHLWSLGIEEQFYIVWPLFLWFVWKRKFNLLAITIVATASFILNLKGVKQDMVTTFYLPQTRFWELLSGSLLAWFTLYKKDAFANFKSKFDYWFSRVVYRKKHECDGKTLANLLSFLGLFLLLYEFWQIDKDLSFPGKWALVPVLGSVLLISAGSEVWFNCKILSNKIAVGFGLISFPLYLWHWPLLSFARIVYDEVPSLSVRTVAVELSIILAWLTYKLVECPLRFGKNSKVKVALLVVFMIIVGYIGLYTKSRDGLEFRSANAPTFMFADINDKFLKEILFDLSKSRFDESCRSILGEVDGVFCQTNSKNPTTLIIGDSHAISISYDPLISGYGNIAVVAANACLPFSDHALKLYNNGKSYNACSQLLPAAVQLIERFDSIKNVVFVSRGPLYIEGKGFGDTEKTMDFRIVKNSTDENPDSFKNFVDGYVDAAQKFINLGRYVTFVIDVPELGIATSSCVDNRPLRFQAKNFASCTIPKEVVLKRQESYRLALSKISETLKGDVILFDTLDKFCDHDTCYGIKDKLMLYNDDDHLSKTGSKFIFKTLLSFINKDS